MAESPVVSFGPFSLDPANARLSCAEREIALRPRPFAVLCYFVERPDQLITLEELRQQVWQGAYVSRSVLRGAIRDIRRALSDTAKASQYLQTVGHKGYRFHTPDADPQNQTSAWRAASHKQPIQPIIGRQQELSQLQQWFRAAQQGQRQVVLISGEAGMGKTTLIELFLASLGPGDSLRISWGQCIDHYGEGEAYLPLLPISYSA